MNRFVAFLAVFAFASAGVVDLTPENFDKVVDGSKGVFVEFFAPWCGHCKSLAPEYEIVGEAFAKEASVVIAKVDADAHRDLGSRFDVHGFPTLKWFPKGSTTPETYEGGRSADDLITYINGKAGTRARVKKAPSHVTDLTDASFDSIVLDSSKDVLVEFYAPWCGHCKRLAPDYEKVATAFASEPGVVIAKIDADAHKEKAGKYGVTGFPTIKFFGKNSKQDPVAYENARDVQSFVDFINEKAGTSRSAEGRLGSKAGRIEALDVIASKFLSGDQAALVKEAEGVVAGLTGADKENGKYYVKVMSVLQSKGKAFLDSEPGRLDRMLEGSAVTPAKIDEFTIRKNILAAFSSA
jgi:protein disulfide-isomerase A6